MKKLFIVSNRLPITVSKRDGSLKLQSSVGGLATGLDSFHKSYKSLWIGWPGYVASQDGPEKRQIARRLKEKNCYPVFLSPYDVENYYHGFCNKTIWPLFHYFNQHVQYSEKYWNAYQRVNAHFLNIVMKVAGPEDKIWIHDYQLMLLPQLIRKKLPTATIGFFLHIPWPSSEIFRLLPCRDNIIKGLLGADLIGFHTHDYIHHFTESVRRLLGYDYSLNTITVEDRLVSVDAFPMGIDYQRFYSASTDPRTYKEVNRMRKKLGDRKIIISIDRLDYTKGIPQRLEAFELFLEQNPSFRKKVTLILVAVPSRTNVEHYVLLKKQVDELISRINGKYGDIGWVPIWYLYRYMPFHKLVPLYCIGDVALVTPLRDGMNLIAKEYIACKTEGQGVLILGELAGAAQELGEAFIVNPNNRREIAAALKQALTLPLKEQQKRNSIMQKRLQRYHVERWAHDFMDRMLQAKEIQEKSRISRLDDTQMDTVVKDYLNSTSRLLLLDYDGTLISFTDDPASARPDRETRSILKKLAADTRNNVVIVSGRNKEILDTWFDNEELEFIAEHGVWLRAKNKKWRLIESLSNKWKPKIKPVLELYVDRTPGSFIEEKDFSLVWHYRKADPKLAKVRASELILTLRHLTANLNLGILEGSKVIEIKNAGINKGRAVLEWLRRKKWQFIMAAGDDWTDEDIFAVLPPTSYSIKVGMGYSKARYNIETPEKMRQFLKKVAHSR
jgi:trehalose 6-phosphate synthase/phosphatase